MNKQEDEGIVLLTESEYTMGEHNSDYDCPPYVGYCYPEDGDNCEPYNDCSPYND